jgi:hypothetical protein
MILMLLVTMAACKDSPSEILILSTFALERPMVLSERYCLFFRVLYCGERDSIVENRMNHQNLCRRGIFSLIKRKNNAGTFAFSAGPF